MSFQKKIQQLLFGSGSEAAVSEAVPSGGARRLWYVIRWHYLELIGLNLLFLVCCLPILTIPAALSGTVSILMKWVRDEPVSFWGDYFAEFKAAYFGRLLVWLLLAVAPMSLSLYPLILGFEKGGFAVLVLTGAFSLLFQSYLFPIFVLVDVSPGTALKNALLIAFVEWKCSLRILLNGGILFTVCFLFPAYAVPVVVICLVSLWLLMVCLWVNEPIRRRLILA